MNYLKLSILCVLLSHASTAISEPASDDCGEVVAWESFEYPLVGNSPEMTKVKTQILKIARLSTPTVVTIVGETGTGKEGVARAIHQLGHRKDGPFLAVNSAVIPQSRAQSDFFGHSRGAFTGAHADHAGFFERTSGGTLFLDEFNSLSMDLQAMLLRVIEGQPFERVGGRTLMTSNSHLIFAFNQNPETCVQNKTLREDLYYRVSGLVIKMPPLRERESDIPLIVNHFIEKRFPNNPIQLSDEAMAFLRGQYWPGNIRQLQNVLLSAQLFSDDNNLDIEALRNAYVQSDLLQIKAESSDSFLPATALTLIEAEDFQIIRVLRISQGNKTRAAELLKVNRGTLDRKLTGMLARKTLPEDLVEFALPE